MSSIFRKLCTVFAMLLLVPTVACDPASGGGLIQNDAEVQQDGEVLPDVETPTCGPDNCLGCCNSAGNCVNGVSNQACGLNGVACAACGITEVCEVGVCVVPSAACNSDNCAGCCDGDTCETGNQDVACGAGGDTCTVCGPSEICEDNVCVVPPACTPSNCDGCCNGDVCETGTSNVACGDGGFACAVCNSSETCTSDGFCEAVCGPSTCSGCCDSNGICVDGGSDDNACGMGGLVCSSCATDETCSAGMCIDTSCQATCAGCCLGATCHNGDQNSYCGSGGDTCQACGAGRTCNANGDCTVDPNSHWDVVLFNVTTSLTDPNGDAWDAFGGLPDPYVRLTAGGVNEAEKMATSSVVQNATTALWDTVLISNVTAAQLKDQFCYSIYDEDVSNDDLIAAGCINLYDWHFSGTLRTKVDNYATLRYRIVLH